MDKKFVYQVGNIKKVCTKLCFFGIDGKISLCTVRQLYNETEIIE